MVHVQTALGVRTIPASRATAMISAYARASSYVST